MAEFHRGFVFERDRTAPLTIEGNPIPFKRAPGGRGFIAMLPPPSRKAITGSSISALARRYIDRSDDLVQRQRVTQTHLHELSLGRASWNRWRRQNPDIKPMLAFQDLRVAFKDEPLDDYDFSYTNLCQATLRGLELKRANFHQAILAKADLSGAHLEGANFCRTDLYETNLEGAFLTGANLQAALMVNTNLRNADLRRCKVYGLSAWDLALDNADQTPLQVRYRLSSARRSNVPEEEVTIEGLDLAGFMYLTLNNRNISRIFEATGRRWVLLLGRLTRRKSVLTAVAGALKERDFTPIIFDFPPPRQRDLIETVILLAGMSAFVIVEITDPRSTPMELQAIAMNYGVPIVPIMRKGAREFGTFSGLRKFHWVLPTIEYTSTKGLIARLHKDVITPATAAAARLIERKRRARTGQR
jgi:uncharacterized protein YjbI with pentapeptide repeats